MNSHMCDKGFSPSKFPSTKWTFILPITFCTFLNSSRDILCRWSASSSCSLHFFRHLVFSYKDNQSQKVWYSNSSKLLYFKCTCTNLWICRQVNWGKKIEKIHLLCIQYHGLCNWNFTLKRKFNTCPNLPNRIHHFGKL